MSSAASHAIKHRDSPKDVFYTPTAVARTHISLIPTTDDEMWFDPFKGKGVYYDNVPAANTKDWCEITEGKDFFAFKEKVDVICSNPPYSMLNAVLKTSVELRPRVISYLLLHGAMTPRRLAFMAAAGYGLVAIHTSKVYEWYGIVEAYVFEKGKSSDSCRITWDNIVHRPDDYVKKPRASRKKAA